MTKQEALQEFKNYILPNLIKKYGEKDKAAMRKEWNEFTDFLHKEGDINEKQYNEWENPFK